MATTRLQESLSLGLRRPSGSTSDASSRHDNTGPAVYEAASAPPARTLLDVLAATVRANPWATALDDGSTLLTYRQLSREAAATAARLNAAGVGIGDRVGIRMSSGSAGLYVAILGVLTAGAAYVPTDADDPPERAETIWREAGVCAVLQDGPTLTLRPEVPPRGGRRAATPADDAWIIFTSGSSGTPKGVAVTHRSAAALVDAEAGIFCQDTPLAVGDRVLAGLSVAFDASCEEMWLAWRSGAALVPAPRAVVRSGAELGPWLLERGISVVSTVPTLAALWPAPALASVRLLILGGESCSAELVGRLDDGVREVWNTYGPTEATVVSCGTRVRTDDDEVRIGLPLPGWQLAVVEPDGNPVQWGQVGELVIGGAGLGRYLDPKLDVRKYAALDSLGWSRAYRTGDLVRADRQGLVFRGRADDQVKIGGRRIELGEIEAALCNLPGVAAAAAAVHRTGTAVVTVGYVVPDGSRHMDTGAARDRLAAILPAAMVPVITIVDGLPMKASGKVDRDALGWPPSPPVTPDDPAQNPPDAGERPTEVAQDAEIGGLPWLRRQWEQVLGPMPLTADTDFFEAGGSSLTAARLASALRMHYPTLSVADLYHHPRLSDQARRLAALGSGSLRDTAVRPTPAAAAPVQFVVTLALLAYQGLRGLLVLLTLENLLPGAPWCVHTSWWLLAAGWVLLFSAPGRLVTTVVGARALLHGIGPGTYPRGGSVHLRVWAAERLAATGGIAGLTGTPWAPRFARVLGCRVGRDVSLHTTPPLTGFAVLGDGATVEPEVDLAGWWLDGDQLHIGWVTVGAGARVGVRSTLMPGAVVGPHAEVAPGSCVTAAVPGGRLWTGSPAVDAGPAGRSWPPPRERTTGWGFAYTATVLGLGILPLLASLPALALCVYLLLGHLQTVASALGRLLIAAPPAAVIGWVSYLLVIAAAVRAAGIGLRPGMHRDGGLTAWRVWLIERLVGGSRAAFFPLYASLGTSAWLRLLGVRVGRHAEVSTALFIPRLTTVGDGSFLADDCLVGHAERHGGWLRLGTADVGARAFVGNSAIVGPGKQVPDGALIGVLSSAPDAIPCESTWLGRPPLSLPRVPAAADVTRTFAPPRRLVAARAGIELLRLVPMMVSLVLANLVAAGLAVVISQHGRLTAAAVAPALLLAGGILACVVATTAKWLLVGRVRSGEHPLWSSFVWRNELADTFVEQLAVPWLAGAALGSPLFALWMRSMGARLGRGVWCETYWFPEPDLIEVGDGVSVNRGCVVQTHLFHDRIMRLDLIRFGTGTALGPHGIVLPGATVGMSTSVGACSLVMRGETLPARTRWFGNPVRAWADGPAPRPQPARDQT